MYYSYSPCILVSIVASKSSKNVARWKKTQQSSVKAVGSMKTALATPSHKETGKAHSKNYLFLPLGAS